MNPESPVQLFDFAGRPIPASVAGRPPEGLAYVYDPTWQRYDLHPSRGLTGPTLEEYFLQAAQNGEVYYQSRLAADIEEKDWDVSTALATRKLAAQGIDWEIVPDEHSPRKTEVADHVTEALQAIDMESAILGFMDAVFKGFACLQLHWGPGGVLRRVEHVEPHNFTFRAVQVDAEQLVPASTVYAPNGLMLGGGAAVPRLLTREQPVYGLELEPFRWAYHRYQARGGDPARQGLIRTIGWMYLFKMAGVKNFARFIERHGMPFVLAKVDEQAWQTDRGKIAQVIRSFGPDGGAVFSRAVEIELLEAAKSDGAGYLALINYFGAAATKVILGQTLTTDTPSAGGGTRAQGSVHQLVRQDILEADCKGNASTIKRDIITPIVGFKFGFDEPVPSIKFKYEPPADQTERANVTKTLSDAGWERNQAEISKEFGMTLTKKAAPEPPPLQDSGFRIQDRGETATAVPHSAAVTAPAEVQDALDQLVASSLQEAVQPDVIGPMTAPVQAAINRAVAHATTAEEFRGALAALLAEIPALQQQMDVRRFAGVIARGIGPAMIDGALSARRTKTTR